MKFLSDLSVNTRAWQLLSLTVFALELSALYFQYVMGLAPCIMCIYQRTALWGIFFAGIVGSMGNKNIVLRSVAFTLWGVGAIWGLLIAIEHVEIQSATLSFLYSCEFVPNFPSWAPLHEWLPSLFEATGDCGDINWQFFGYTMPQMMIVVFGGFTAVLVVILLAQLINKKSL
ncbi:disulfide bond formation protein B [Colwellia sp. PAMC 20917]|uniref:disulfide bond formation protein DsbB n=1 Tax=Colwellia sp. PAMC 20917 TaxID=1816218 RepID=UPI000878BAFF|nr:disulfide bond formation protein DsbB [Colwellia sp. PAMC 20917]AOW78419.1 disulfide bond formation protein B [Colwellia sp. PAMC 20917]